MRLFTAGLLSFALLPIMGHAQQSPEGTPSLAPSAVFFKVLGAENGLFNIAAEPGESAVDYDLANSEIAFRLYDSDQAGLDNPLFCFDFAAEPASPQLRLNVTGAGGQKALDSIGLSSALEYRLTGSEIVFAPAASVQCFYIGGGAQASFGLFGQPPIAPGDAPPEPDGLVFRDRFESNDRAGLEVRFADPLGFTPSGTASYGYRLIVENTGDLPLTQIFLQEVFSSSESVHGAALGAGSWSCTELNGATCPASPGSGSVRLQPFSLQPGQGLEFTVERELIGPSGAVVQLYAGAVNGPGAGAVFDVALRSVEIPGGN